MSSLENLKKSRKAIRTVFKKVANAILDLTTQPEIPLEEIDIKWTLLQNKRESLREIDKQVYEKMETGVQNEADLINEIENADEYESLFQKVKAKVTSISKSSSAESVVSESSMGNNRAIRKFKLPLLEIKKFGGDVKEWLPFWTQFLKIHEDSTILPEDKFQYLQQATISGTRARQVVESFPLSRDNYLKVIEALQSRFGRDEFLIEVYVRELLKLVLQNTGTQEKHSLSTLYDMLETQLRALETLGVTTEKYEAMLFPLIESALPEEILRIWQRSSHFTQTQIGCNNKENRLKSLMNFIKNEVESEQRINLATEGFNLTGDKNRKVKKSLDQQIPTAAGLVNYDTSKCIFCEGNHNSEKCFRLQKMSLEEKKQVLARKRACFRCAKIGHQRKNCRERNKCLVCGKQHIIILCPELNAGKTDNSLKKTDSVGKNESSEVSLSQLANPTHTTVFLQTLRVRMYGDRGSRVVRALFDSGSQRSYVLNSTARELNYSVKRSQNLIHSLFGGAQTEEQKHNCYEARVCSLTNDYSCKFEVMDQQVICNNISDIAEGVWTRELRRHGIELTDNKGSEPIQLLIGADVSGQLFTGRRLVLECGLVAVHTLLGWVLMGKTPNALAQRDTTMVVTSLQNSTRAIKDWWELDVLGITDPVEKVGKIKAYELAKETFHNAITVNEDGRYEIRLPWMQDHPPLATNERLAKKRLQNMLVKLNNNGYQEQYQEVFDEWHQEEIIEMVGTNEKEMGRHYLPHRPIIKENSLTTKVRPVFDASARELNSPSLNDCLEKGENLIELIPKIILRFREERFGVVADIKKAFLQISVNKDDRDFLRFFWRNKEGVEITFRHRRVVFGVNSSPFILAATIDYHLDQCLKEVSAIYSQEMIRKLRSSFYVDNCVTSVSDKEELIDFIQEATAILKEGKFELRGWEHTNDSREETTYVLGLLWNKRNDTLAISYKENPLECKKITKREILSIAQRIFDPIGFTSPATLFPKLLLQKLWVQKIGWDQEVETNTKVLFQKWMEELPLLKNIQIPRWIRMSARDQLNITLHTFCDASCQAYAAAVFLRNETTEGVFVYLIAGKSRVAPIKKLSIPRLELLAATIGARLWSQVKTTLNAEVTSYFWTDSTTVLSWIKRKEEWSVFVWNRIQEIRKLTEAEYWNHVPGEKNPADLLSRGCSPKELTTSRWWEGPKWLYQRREAWPKMEVCPDEEEVSTERRRNATRTLLFTEDSPQFYLYFSKYCNNIRMIAWILRFIYNCKNPKERKQGELSAEEVKEGEKKLVRIAQQEAILPLKKEIENNLRIFSDEEGLLRVESRLTNREDTKDFLYPYLMPAKHPITQRLIHHIHVSACHVKGQGLMSILREKFWILGGRHAIRVVTNKCVKCRRHDGKQMEVETPSLPINRVRDAAVFEVTGVDLAGPLFLKDKTKVWICLFTCAVYRAIHLEIVCSLSAHDFLNALRRFIARRGRPTYIYTDNGTNFRGTENSMKELDWANIQKDTSVGRINWRFNPPSAPWWGGWWERLVGTVKKLLRKTLGRASITGDELHTILCDCEAVINARPLTYMSNSDKDLKTLSPSIFLTEIKEYGVPDLDKINLVSLNRRHKYLQRLRSELRNRFRVEYLGQLVRRGRVKTSDNISIGEIVLIGSENIKRIDWPLARVVQLLPGKDNVVRLVRLQTAHGQLLRPVQKLYSLECVPRYTEAEENRNGESEVSKEPADEGAGGRGISRQNEFDGFGEKSVVEKDSNDHVPYVTKGGRQVRQPNRYM